MELNLLFAIAFVGAFLCSLAANQWLKGRAHFLGLIDWPGEPRRLHTRPTAVVGGSALMLTIGLVAGVAVFGFDLAERYPAQFASLVPLFGGAVAICLAGLLDDLRKLPSSVKFAFQVLVSVAVVAGGIRIGSLEVPFLGIFDLSAPVGVGLTVFWLVGITNAFNLIDGTDGLAAGAALLSTGAMFVVSLILGHELIALVLGITAAAIVGFLHYNYPPASVFLGDSGSQMLGFLLAGLGVVGATKAATAVAITVPVVAFGLPVLDTALAIVRRALRGDSIVKADRSHIHHRLVDLGLSSRGIVLVLYAACGLFAIASLVTLSSERLVVGPVYGAVFLGIGYGIHRLRIPELLELRRLWGEGAGIRRSIHRNVAIRERARELGEMDSLPRILAKLSDALEETAYDEAELWIHGRYLRQLPSAGPEITRGTLVGADDEGFIWRWSRNGFSERRYQMLELRAPVLVAERDAAARIAIRRGVNVEIPDGLAVLSDALLPAAARALQNARDLGTAEVVSVEEPFLHVQTADTQLRTASG